MRHRVRQRLCVHTNAHIHTWIIHTYMPYIRTMYLHIHVHSHTYNAHQQEVSVSSPHAHLDGIRGSHIPSWNGLTDQNRGAQIVSPLSRRPHVAPLPSVQDSLQSTLGPRLRRHFVPRSAQTPTRSTATNVGRNIVIASTRTAAREEADGTGMSRISENSHKPKM